MVAWGRLLRRELAMAQNTRGRLLIDRDVQRALLWQMLRHWTAFVIVLIAMLLAVESLSGPPRSLATHVQALWTQHAALLVVIAALFPVFAYDSVKLSNRFVGPIMRLRGALRAASAGEPVRPLQFRKNDFWQDMAEHFNQLMEQAARKRDRHDMGPTDVWNGSDGLEATVTVSEQALQEV